MDPLTIALVTVSMFVLFLMLTSGHRRHRLEEALKKLEKERMRLMKSIEHVKLSFYHKKLDEKEAQDRIFEYEEKLRNVQDRILEIKEKPLMRTIKKHEEEDKKAVKEEAGEIRESERLMMANFAARSVVILFVMAAVAIMVVSVIFGIRWGETPSGSNPFLQIPVSARISPEGSTYPGSSAGLRVEMSNTLDKNLEDVRVTVRAPKGSGIDFGEGEIGVKIIPELERGGVREVYFPIRINQDAEEGEYIIGVEAENDYDNLKASTTARLVVRVGAEENA